MQHDQWALPDAAVLEIFQKLNNCFHNAWQIDTSRLAMTVQIECPQGYVHAVQVRNDLFGRMFFITITADVHGIVLHPRARFCVQYLNAKLRRDQSLRIEPTAQGDLVMRRTHYLIYQSGRTDAATDTHANDATADALHISIGDMVHNSWCLHQLMETAVKREALDLNELYTFYWPDTENAPLALLRG